MIHPHYRRYMCPSRMTSDRSSMVARQVVGLGDELADDTLVRESRVLLEASESAADLEDERRMQRESRSGDSTNEFDTVADAAVHQIFDDMTGTLKYLVATKDPRAKAVERFEERHFATGVGYITAARYETQLHRMERLVEDANGPSAALVDGLGWRRKVEAIEAAIGPYREAIAARQRVTSNDVREAQDGMHVALCRLLGYVLWAYADRPELRERVLAPVDDQQDRIAAMMRARRAGRSTAVDEAAVADEAEAREGPVEGPSDEERVQAEAPDAEGGAAEAGPEAAEGAPAVDEPPEGPGDGQADGPSDGQAEGDSDPGARLQPVRRP